MPKVISTCKPGSPGFFSVQYFPEKQFAKFNFYRRIICAGNGFHKRSSLFLFSDSTFAAGLEFFVKSDQKKLPPDSFPKSGGRAKSLPSYQL